MSQENFPGRPEKQGPKLPETKQWPNPFDLKTNPTKEGNRINNIAGKLSKLLCLAPLAITTSPFLNYFLPANAQTPPTTPVVTPTFPAGALPLREIGQRMEGSKGVSTMGSDASAGNFIEKGFCVATAHHVGGVLEMIKFYLGNKDKTDVRSYADVFQIPGTDMVIAISKDPVRRAECLQHLSNLANKAPTSIQEFWQRSENQDLVFFTYRSSNQLKPHEKGYYEEAPRTFTGKMVQRITGSHMGFPENTVIVLTPSIQEGSNVSGVSGSPVEDKMGNSVAVHSGKITLEQAQKAQAETASEGEKQSWQEVMDHINKGKEVAVISIYTKGGLQSVINEIQTQAAISYPSQEEIQTFNNF